MAKTMTCRGLAHQAADAKLAGISREVFAEKCDITPSDLSQFITGKRLPGLVVLARICNALDCQPGDILSMEET